MACTLLRLQDRWSSLCFLGLDGVNSRRNDTSRCIDSQSTLLGFHSHFPLSFDTYILSIVELSPEYMNLWEAVTLRIKSFIGLFYL